MSGWREDDDAAGHQGAVRVVVVGEDRDPERGVLIGGGRVIVRDWRQVIVKDGDGNRGGVCPSLAVTDGVGELAS